ncbi:S-4TM family putative pore-forming effector [Hyalangium rubrum]|uniref:S-4TM family putative pore-forming effector n=1 Tax=Hyalangium rubrum TaxID=3103134 RepID=A0ABU5HAL5_9BACT|nr:S-4TM family putative pore-forming effector [Hyalangium sp. s54d21]MDY7229904.1 S-4TM family putative pore-forming effector [Hyalangium sp. s54d21]
MSVPNDISLRQDLEENLERLAAQRALYSRAKAVRGASVLVVTLLAIGSLPVAIYWPKASAALGLFALLWTLVELVLLDGLEEQNRQKAALIQEDFDTRVFGLPWNPALGVRPIPEAIVDAGKPAKGDPILKGWYADAGPLPRALAVLASQRSCVAWDHRARHLYQFLLASIALVLVVAAVALALATNQSLSSFLVGFAVPLMPALQHTIKTFKAHRRAGAEQERFIEELSSTWEEGVTNGGAIPDAKLRLVQDRLLLLRREQTPVPDYLYRWLRSRYEAAMREATQRLVSEAVARLAR